MNVVYVKQLECLEKQLMKLYYEITLFLVSQLKTARLLSFHLSLGRLQDEDPFCHVL